MCALARRSRRSVTNSSSRPLITGQLIELRGAARAQRSRAGVGVLDPAFGVEHHAVLFVLVAVWQAEGVADLVDRHGRHAKADVLAILRLSRESLAGDHRGASG